MGIDVRCLLKDHITPEQIVEFLKTKYENVSIETVCHSFNRTKLKDITFNFIKKPDSESETWDICSGFIAFTDGEDKRLLHYFHDNIIETGCIQDFIDYTLPKSENVNELLGAYITSGVSISLGLWNNAVEIITEICNHFGGWIDENDCDEIGYKYIEKEV